MNIIEDAQMERLAQQISIAKGMTIVDVLRESLASLENSRGLPTEKASLRERLARIGAGS